jgi:predicted TIM-barrel fold metal-dependent hydrolase
VLGEAGAYSFLGKGVWRMNEQLPIIDTHQHLIYLDRSEYQWANAVPQLRGRSFRYEDYLVACSDTGIQHTIFMETSPDSWREEISWVYKLAGQEGSLIKGIVANCRPEEVAFDSYLDSIQHDRLVGLRRICLGDTDQFSRQSRFVENVRRLSQRGLTFDLCFSSRQLRLAEALASKCSTVQFILDHCGMPDIAAGALNPWRDDLRRIAELPNVVCKISGLLAYCRPDNATLEAVRPYVLHAIDCFGPNRLLWGSDWPVVNCNNSLAAWVRITRQLLADLSHYEQRKILHGNAQGIYAINQRS